MLDQLHAAASGIGSVRQSAIYASCLHLIESASSSAELEGEHSASLSVRLGAIVKGMVDRGSASYELVIGAAAAWNYCLSRSLMSSAACGRNLVLQDRATWPRSTETTIRPQESVLNFRLRPSARSPWKGSPALPGGNTTAALFNKMEAQLISEAAMKPARVLGAGFSKEQREQVSRGLEAAGIRRFPIG